ncbi:MAG: MBL fold metallo-hydrolase [Patescibacteria group bacterium]
MMITFHGLSCFSFNVKTTNGEANLVVDPYTNETGLRIPRTLTADIVASSHKSQNANNFEAIVAPEHGATFVVDLPGEYEVKGLFVYAINAPLKDGKTSHRIFRIEAEGMTIAHLGAIDRTLTDEEVCELGSVDVLILPVGGNRVLDAKTAMEVIEEIEPRLVIPSNFAVSNLKENLADVDAFCKVFGSCEHDTSNKLKLMRKDLPEEEMIARVLSRE